MYRSKASQTAGGLAQDEAALTQRELAKLAGIRHETLCRIESGKHTPSMASVTRLERALQGRTAGKRNGHRK